MTWLEEGHGYIGNNCLSLFSDLRKNLVLIDDNARPRPTAIVNQQIKHYEITKIE